MLQEKGDILVYKINVQKVQQVKRTSSSNYTTLFSTLVSVSVTSIDRSSFLSFWR